MKREKVIFRVWTSSPGKGDVIALFPHIPADIQPYRCQSYEHVGQHGAADYLYVLTKTRPAKPFEYRDLYKELYKLGYRMKIATRSGQQDLHAREQYLKSLNLE